MFLTKSRQVWLIGIVKVLLDKSEQRLGIVEYPNRAPVFTIKQYYKPIYTHGDNLSNKWRFKPKRFKTKTWLLDCDKLKVSLKPESF